MLTKIISIYYFLTPTFSMIIRDDISPSNYDGIENNYPAVFLYPDTVDPGSGCAATLINSGYAVTAAHCFDDISTPFTVAIGGVQHTVSTVLLNPCFSFDYDGPNGMDLALIKLDTPSYVSPINIYTESDEVGKIITLVG